MPQVLTEQSTLQCAHAGSVQLVASQSKLKVKGAAVLVQGDLDGKAISACPTPVQPPPPGPVSKPCLLIASTIEGVARRLKVGGKGVLLQTIQGQTDGQVANVPQTWSVADAGQTKLQTV